jgi:hypothetical protein
MTCGEDGETGVMAGTVGESYRNAISAWIDRYALATDDPKPTGPFSIE